MEEVTRLMRLSQPWSPVGYKVTLISEEIVPVAPPAPRPKPRFSKPAPRRIKPGFYWSPVILGGFFLLVALVGSYWLLASPARIPVPARLQPVQAMVQRPQAEVIIPAELAAAGPELAEVAPVKAKPEQQANPPEELQQPDQPAPAQNACAQGDRETFGTEVAFVRNAQEAARLARQEHKLAFLLHVSGNFEDNAFT
jgi:hypothetical protein